MKHILYKNCLPIISPRKIYFSQNPNSINYYNRKLNKKKYDFRVK